MDSLFSSPSSSLYSSPVPPTLLFIIIFLILFRYLASPFSFSSTPSSFFPPPLHIHCIYPPLSDPFLRYSSVYMYSIFSLPSLSSCSFFSCSSFPAPPHLSFYFSFPNYPPPFLPSSVYSSFLLSPSIILLLLLFLILLLMFPSIYMYSLFCSPSIS